MHRKNLLWSLLLAAAVGPAWAETRTTLGIHINVGDPSPPVIVVREEPRVVLVPGSTVYVVDDGRVDFDCFRYGVYWYAYSNDRWYRARSYRGPFVMVQARYVPRAVVIVPARHWKRHPHGGPPGQMKKHSASKVESGNHGQGRGKH